MTKAEFARRMGIRKQNVKALFKSKNRETIYKAAGVMGVSFEMLVGYIEELDLRGLPFTAISEASRSTGPRWIERHICMVSWKGVGLDETNESVAVRMDELPVSEFVGIGVDEAADKLFKALNEWEAGGIFVLCQVQLATGEIKKMKLAFRNDNQWQSWEVGGGI